MSGDLWRLVGIRKRAESLQGRQDIHDMTIRGALIRLGWWGAGSLVCGLGAAGLAAYFHQSLTAIVPPLAAWGITGLPAIAVVGFAAFAVLKMGELATRNMGFWNVIDRAWKQNADKLNTRPSPP